MPIKEHFTNSQMTAMGRGKTDNGNNGNNNEAKNHKKKSKNRKG